MQYTELYCPPMYNILNSFVHQNDIKYMISGCFTVNSHHECWTADSLSVCWEWSSLSPNWKPLSWDGNGCVPSRLGITHHPQVTMSSLPPPRLFLPLGSQRLIYLSRKFQRGHNLPGTLHSAWLPWPVWMWQSRAGPSDLLGKQSSDELNLTAGLWSFRWTGRWKAK